MANKIDLLVELQDKASKGIQDVGKSVKGLSDNVEKGGISFGSLTGSIFKAELALKALDAGINGLKSLGSFAIKSAADLQQTNTAFTTMTGSAETAKVLMQQLSDFAAATPFEFPDIAKTGQTLLAMGVNAGDLKEKLRVLGDAAAGNAENFKSVALVYGQVKLQGKLMGQDLMQFVNAGIPLVDELAKNLHKSTAQIKDMVSAGQISFKDVDAALTSMTAQGGKFYHMMDAQSQTFTGLVSTAHDIFGQFARNVVGMANDGTIKKGSIFYYLNEGLKGLLIHDGELSGFASKIRQFTTGFSILAQSITGDGNNIFDALQLMGISSDSLASTFTTVIQTIIRFVKDLAQEIKNRVNAIIDVFSSFIDIIKGLNLKPIAQALGDLGQAVFKVFKFVNQLINDALHFFAEWIKENKKAISDFINLALMVLATAFYAVKEAIKATIEIIKDVIKWFGDNKEVAQSLAIIIGTVAAAIGIYNIALGIAAAATAAYNIIAGIATAVTTGFGIAMAILTAPITIVVLVIGLIIAALVLLAQHSDEVQKFLISVWNNIAGFFKGIGTAISGAFNGMASAIASAFLNAWIKAQEFMTKIGTFIGTTIDGIKGLGKDIFDGVVGGIKSGINVIIKSINDMIGNINSIVIDSLNKLNVGGVGVNIGKIGTIPMLAKGGMMSQSGYAIVGEQGPELVRLPGGSQVYSNQDSQKMVNNSTSQNITMNVYRDADINNVINALNFQLR